MRYHSTYFLKVWNLRFTWAGYGDDVIDHFRKKSLFFLDTRDHQEHDTKNRLSIPSPSPEKLMAEIHELKKTDLRDPQTEKLVARRSLVSVSSHPTAV